MEGEPPPLPSPTWRELGLVQDPDFDLSYVTDRDGVIRWITAGMAELLGGTPDEFLGTPSFAFIHPDDHSEVHAHRDALRRTGHVEDRFVRFLTSVGGYQNFLVRVRPVLDSDGSISARMVTLSDQLARVAVLRALSTLTSATPVLIEASTEEALLQGVCNAIVRAEGYSLAWYGRAHHDEQRSVSVDAQAGAHGDYLASIRVSWNEEDPAGQGPTGIAIRTGRAQVRNRLRDDPQFTPWANEASMRGIECSLSIPVHVDGGVDGALMAYGDHDDAFDDVAMRLMEIMASDLGSAIERLRARIRLEDSQQASVRMLATTVETRDPYTAGHQARVADLSRRLGRELGMDEDRLVGLHLGAMIHDVGKIAVPREVLNKPSRLTDEDWTFIREHPVTGDYIASQFPWPWPIAQIVSQHHERLDGSGYPHGLVGEQIILEARIVAVADVYEAICHRRPYRTALGHDHALNVLLDGSDTLFDAKVIDALIAIVADGFVLED